LKYLTIQDKVLHI